MGIKNILIGGMNLVRTGNQFDDKPQYDECVAWTRDALAPHFNVTLSSISAPDRPIRQNQR